MVPGSGSLHPESQQRRRTAIDAAFAALLVAALAACEKAPVVEEPVVRPVRYAEVSLARGAERRTYSGTSQAELETDLSFRVSGTLLRRTVDVGDSVERGDRIAFLDDQDYRVRLDEARAGLARAEAERRNADSSYQRTRDLYENQNASRTQLDSARAMAESAEAQYRASAQQVEAAELQLSYTRLTAPQSCTIAGTFVELNQNVSAGQPILRVNCGQCAEVVVDVPDTDIARITPGMNVAVSIAAMADVDLRGTVQEVGVATGAGGSTYSVTIALQDGCETVRSGMAVDVGFEFPTTNGDDSITIPYVSVGEDAEGNFVYVLERDGDDIAVAKRRGVEIGIVTGDGIVITDGLTPGELIATAGVRRLEPGQRVRLLPTITPDSP